MKKLLSALLGLMFTGISAVHAGDSITIKGSTTVLPIAQATAEKFMEINPDVDISVQGGGSGVGIASVIDGTCDIGDSSRSIKESEMQKAATRGRYPKAHLVAMDGIAVIVHPSNKAGNLTKKQLKDIYTGKIKNWSEIGGKNEKIVVISRDTASGTYEAFNTLALDGLKVRPDALLEASNRSIATKIAQTPQAIGYVGIGYLTPSVKALTVNGVMPTKENVLTKSYLLSRPLFMYTNGSPEGTLKRYIDFVISKEGQSIVEEVGFVGIK